MSQDDLQRNANASPDQKVVAVFTSANKGNRRWSAATNNANKTASLAVCLTGVIKAGHMSPSRSLIQAED